MNTPFKFPGAIYSKPHSDLYPAGSSKDYPMKNSIRLHHSTLSNTPITNSGCALGGLIVLALGVTALIYTGLGALGWNGIKKHVNYEDKYYSAVSLADKNKDGDLDKSETEAFFKELGTVRLPNQNSTEVRPSYKSLTDYINRNK